jgi:hypothetical protein
MPLATFWVRAAVCSTTTPGLCPGFGFGSGEKALSDLGAALGQTMCSSPRTSRIGPCHRSAPAHSGSCHPSRERFLWQARLHERVTVRNLTGFPCGIALEFLPPCPPELNPQENIWDEIREKIFKNYALESMPTAFTLLIRVVSTFGAVRQESVGSIFRFQGSYRYDPLPAGTIAWGRS